MQLNRANAPDGALGLGLICCVRAQGFESVVRYECEIVGRIQDLYIGWDS